MIWIIGMGVALVLCIIAVLYLVVVLAHYLSGAISRFAPIRKAAGEKTWLQRLIAFALLALGFGLITLFGSLMDAVVVLLHLLIFFLLFGLLLRLSRKGKEGKIYWQGHLALLCTVLYLAAGYYQCMHVWKTEYILQTDKPVGTLKIALLSDSHLGTTFDGAGFAEYLDEILAEADRALYADKGKPVGPLAVRRRNTGFALPMATTTRATMTGGTFPRRNWSGASQKTASWCWRMKASPQGRCTWRDGLTQHIIGIDWISSSKTQQRSSMSSSWIISR